MINKWECEKDGCVITACGLGGAIGLRAIGWWVQFGNGAPNLYCPGHRPDKIMCKEDPANECSVCAADAEADKWQVLMKQMGQRVMS